MCICVRALMCPGCQHCSGATAALVLHLCACADVPRLSTLLRCNSSTCVAFVCVRSCALAVNVAQVQQQHLCCICVHALMCPGCQRCSGATAALVLHLCACAHVPWLSTLLRCNSSTCGRAEACQAPSTRPCCGPDQCAPFEAPSVRPTSVPLQCGPNAALIMHRCGCVHPPLPSTCGALAFNMRCSSLQHAVL